MEEAAREPRQATRLERELLVALEAELSEERERTAELEGRVRLLEERLGLAAAVEAPIASASIERPVEVRSIDTWRWDGDAEWSYWLRRCEGFRLVDRSGALGVVHSVRFERDLDLPEALVVLAGPRWRRRRFEVAASELAEILPEERRITLAVPAREWLLPTGSARRGLEALIPRRRGHRSHGDAYRAR